MEGSELPLSRSGWEQFVGCDEHDSGPSGSIK